MFSSFTTALSGLNANSTAIDIIGNNLANLDTTGFKADSVEFSDLMSQQLGASANSAVGLGVAPAQSVMQFQQGSIQQTGGALDAAISGNGLFVVHDNTGQQLYTRAGNFSLGADGSLLTATGEHVQGWLGTAGVVNLTAPVGNISVPLTGVVPAKATTAISINANLDSAAAAGAASANFSAPVQVVDSQGGQHTLTFSFTNTGVNKWSYAITIPAADLVAGGTTTLATGNLVFNGAGQLTTPAAGAPVAVNVAGLADGANNMAMNWNLYDPNNNGFLTQFAQNSGVSSTTQDGLTAGEIVNINMGQNGVLLANYSNGQQLPVAQLALANIQNPETLVSVGDNNLKATADTATPAVGTADSGGRGQVVGGALEGSTVDIAQEFTMLIAAQRSYEANGKVITTSDQMLQTLIQLKQ
ncbi:MAG TPA: flagellar hook protein FlgE [Bryobacteraceae bacterium]|jgi:flagellar hook protein FlgE|nr:flagellar hook protein FlgE [Bryobacteraceae bacterium]